MGLLERAARLLYEEWFVRLQLPGHEHTRITNGELEAYRLKFGDIVKCEGGEPGRCAIWIEQLPGRMIQKAFIAFAHAKT